MRSDRHTGYSKSHNKSVLFFSASSSGDFQQLWDFGVREMLVSYFYIKKSLAYYDKMLPLLREEGGLFMTDSGAFSFMGKFHEGSTEYEEAEHEEFWLPYLEEYIAWIRKYKEYIYCVANLDLDVIVGQAVVDKWNKEYFEPLEKEGIQVVYVAHEGDLYPTILDRLKNYLAKYDYVGVNQRYKKQAAKIHQLNKIYGKRLHGFAWTEFDLLKRFPFFSADSVTWLGGVRFGTTYDYDGKNFRTLDYKKKHLRRANRHALSEIDVDIEDVIKKEKRVPINKMNLLGWMGFRKEYMKYANMKLTNKVVSAYERRE